MTGPDAQRVAAEVAPTIAHLDGPAAALCLAMALESLPGVRLTDRDLRELAAAHDAGGGAVEEWVGAAFAGPGASADSSEAR